MCVTERERDRERFCVFGGRENTPILIAKMRCTTSLSRGFWSMTAVSGIQPTSKCLFSPSPTVAIFVSD